MTNAFLKVYEVCVFAAIMGSSIDLCVVMLMVQIEIIVEYLFWYD